MYFSAPISFRFFVVRFSTCILVLSGLTGSLLFPNLRMHKYVASSIVLLRVGTVWTVLPKVIVTVQATHVLIVGLIVDCLSFLVE